MVQVYCSTGKAPAAEGVANIFDGEGHTKWLAFWKFPKLSKPVDQKESPYVSYQSCGKVNKSLAACEGTRYACKHGSTVLLVPDQNIYDLMRCTVFARACILSQAPTKTPLT